MIDDQPIPEVADRVRITDEQDDTRKTTYSVVIDHMDHGVVIECGDLARASEIEFVLQHELSRAYEDGSQGAWISVEERLPNPGDMVLAWVDTFRGGHCQEAELGQSDLGIIWWDAQGGSLLNVTHWRPMPRGPR